jgi:NADH:ubiquinone oxidoreductase subunit 4 (subunit M)
VLYYLVIAFYIIPIFTIISVLVFPHLYVKTYAGRDIAEVSLFFTGIQVILFVTMLWVQWAYSTSMSSKYKLLRDYTQWHRVELFAEYDSFYIIIDSLNTPLIILNLFLTFTAIYYASHSTTSVALVQKSVVNITLVTFFINILFTTLHLGLFYIMFELLMIPLFFLISMGSRLRRLRAITLFTLYTMTFSYIMLFGLIYIWVWFGTLHYSKVLILLHFLPESILPLQIFWVSLLLAFLAKIPLVPFHIWLPEAHVEATAIGSVLLAGIILKIGAYGIIRFLVPLHGLLAGDIIFTCVSLGSLLSAVYATLMTLAQVDFKRIIAYSSVAHLSFAVAALFNGTKIGIAGSYYYNIGHGFVSAGLFFLAGLFYTRYGTRLLKYYSGLRFFPILGAYFLMYSLANIGFPGTVNFVAELLVINSFIFTNSVTVLILIFLTFFGSLAFSLWTYLRMANGPLSFHTLHQHEDVINLEDISPVGPPMPRRWKNIKWEWMPTTKMEFDIFFVLGVPIFFLGVFPQDTFFEFFKIY